MSDLIIEVQEREMTGKNANRRLRSVGKVPAVVYGGGVEPAKISVENRKVEEILRSAGGENSVFLLKLEGTQKSRHAMIRELQSDSLNGQMIHIDFQRVDMDKAVRVSVPIELVGEAEGVKNEGGFLDFVTREIEIECLPGDIPPSVELDVSAMHVGQHIEAGQLSLPDGIALQDDPERVIVSLSAKQAEVEETEEDDEDLLSAIAAEPSVAGGE